MKTQITSIIAVVMLLGPEAYARQMNIPVSAAPKVLAQSKTTLKNKVKIVKRPDTVEPVAFAQAKQNDIRDAIAATKLNAVSADPPIVQAEAAPATVEAEPATVEAAEGSKMGFHFGKSDSSSHSSSWSKSKSGSGTGSATCSGTGTGACSASGSASCSGSDFRNIGNNFRRYRLPRRNIGTSYSVTGAKSVGHNHSYNVESRPDRIRKDYGVSAGVGNGYSATRAGNAAKKKKTFNINGKIVITESSEGVSGEKSYNCNENAAKNKSKNVSYFKSACGHRHGKCDNSCTSSSESDSSSCKGFKDWKCKPTIGASASAQPVAAEAEVSNTPQ